MIRMTNACSFSDGILMLTYNLRILFAESAIENDLSVQGFVLTGLYCIQQR